MIDIKFKELMKIFFNSIITLGLTLYKLFKTLLVYIIGVLPLIVCGLLVIFSTRYVTAILLLIAELPWLIVFLENLDKMDDRR